MAVQIQLRRGTATQWANTSTGNPILAVGEMALETDTNLFKVGDGYRNWNDLPYGGIQGYVGSQGNVGPSGPTIAVQNVLYVSKSGNDANDGTTLGGSKLTIRAALAVATRGTTIFVKSGDYTEINPMVVPDFVSIIGDNLRSVTVRPQTVTSDIFYVNNGSYIAHVTFKDHIAPAAAVAFPADGSAGVISTSPYVQNCTSMTTTGTGMRVDGNLALGTKSMMVDAFTQYNQGGVGIHMLNSGYTSLVSVFTICCDKGFLCESGGFCSITNSNSSFGNYALYADGVGAVQYEGLVVGDSTGRVFTITNLTSVPSIGDAVGFGNGDYYTIDSTGELTIGDTVVTYPSITAEDAAFRNARQIILSEVSTLQVKTINYVLNAYPGFDFNQFKCSRDVGTILESVCYDMVLPSNYQTVLAGNSYYRAGSSPVIDLQKTQTAAAMVYLKAQTLMLLTPASAPYIRISNLFDIIINIFQNGIGVSPAYVFNPPTGVTSATVAAVGLLQANKEFIKEETAAYISNFSYNTTSCYRDTGLIVDAIAFDLLYGDYSQGTFAGLQYWNQDVGYTGQIANQINTLTSAISYIGTQALTAISGISSTATNRVTSLFNTLTNIIVNGPIGVTNSIIPNSYALTEAGIVSAYNTLISNQTAIADATISYINSTFVSYNTATCYRDVGYILRSVAFDLLHSGNRQSIQAGVYYYGYDTTATVINNEIPQTIAAYKFLNKLAKDLILGKVTEPTYQRGILPVISTSTATVIQTRAIDHIVTTITNIITYGPGVADPRIPIPLTASTSTDVVNSFKILLDNRAFIQSEVTGYINNKFIVRTYNTATCYRDTGLIVDSLAFDIAYGGTTQSLFAGLQYWSQNVGYLDSVINEITTTTAAINYVKGLSAALSTSSTATTIINANFNKILSILSTGTTNVTNSIVPNGSASTSSYIVNVYNTLISEQNNIALQTINWINANNPTLTYNTSTCYRDITYIIQSVAFDLLHGGNRQSVMSGVYYYRYNGYATVIVNQIPQTLAAYAFIGDISEKIILGQRIAYPYQKSVTQTTSSNTATLAEVALIDQSVFTITNIIVNGPLLNYPKVPIGQTFSSTQSEINAYNLLLANRTFIQSETIAYINLTFGNLVYSESLCKRDIGYVVDAVTYDLMYGGNSQTVVAGEAYYDGDTLQISSSEQPASAAAYYFISTILPKIITNTSILVPQQYDTPQYTTSTTSATLVQGNTAAGLLRIIAQVVDEAFTCVVILAENAALIVGNNSAVTFQTFSQIQSSAHNFEWIGAGTNIDAALPYLGGVPITENQAVAVNGGKVYFTGTDQKGNFQIGNELTINNNLGTISGRTFTKSLFAVMTPYILAIGA